MPDKAPPAAPETPANTDPKTPQTKPDTTKPADAIAAKPGMQQPPAAKKPDEGAAADPAKKPDEPERKEPQSKLLADVAKRERKLLEGQRDLKKRLDELDKRHAPFAEAQKLAESGDHLGALEKLGIRYDAVTKQALNRKKPDPNDDLRKEVEDLKKKEADRIAAAATESQQRAATEVRDSIAAHLKEKADDYVAILNVPGGTDEVFAVIAEHARVTGEAGEAELLPVEEAARRVEATLRAGLQKIAPALQRILTPAQGSASEDTKAGATTTPTAPPSTDSKAGNGAADAPRTLRNRDASQAGSPPNPNAKPKGWRAEEKELIRRARARLGE